MEKLHTWCEAQFQLQGLERSLGIPLPVATQCEIAAGTAVTLQPAWDELIRQAAQGEVVHNDDTSMRVLSLDRDRDIVPERTGVFTSGLAWIFREHRSALFFTGCKHAGENLATVLQQRSPDLPRPIQMCDALSRNEPKIPEPLIPLLGPHRHNRPKNDVTSYARRISCCLTESSPLARVE